MDKLDILNRESFVDQLVQLVENISTGEASVSFAIDGTWGCGKSFVLDMFKKKLSQIQSEKTSTDKYLIVRYNCWKYDYYEEPLIAIVATILDEINKMTSLLGQENQEKIKGVLKAVGTTLLSISNSTLKNTVGVDLSKAFDIVKSGMDTGQAECQKMQEYDVFFGFKQTLYTLQNILNKITEQYTLVLLIDELDRCLPEYTIKVLERLHHLTENTNKIINIIAIDKAQLQTIVKHIFGFDDTDKYLKKFIQFSISLNVGNVSEKIVNKYYDYISLFDSSLISISDSIEEYLQNLFMDIDAREQEQLVQKAMLLHKLLYHDIKDYCFMCTELLIVTVEICYQGEKTFTKWFQEIYSDSNLNWRKIPFSSFFNDKLQEIPCKKTELVEKSEMFEYTLNSTDSLYGALAFTWYRLFPGPPNTFVRMPSCETKRLLTHNAYELRQFVDMIKLIK